MTSPQVYRKVTASSQDARNEAACARRGRAIAQSSGLFQVPRLLGCEGPTLVFEYVEGLVDLRSMLRDAPSDHARCALSGRVGRALGAVHLEPSPGTVDRRHSRDRLLSVDPVGVHRDFGRSNLHFTKDSNELVVLDWAPPRWQAQLPIIASSHWDLGLFLVDLHFQRLGDPVGVRGLRGISLAFLDGYASVRPTDFAGLARSVATMSERYYRGRAMNVWQKAARVPSSTTAFAHLRRGPI